MVTIASGASYVINVVDFVIPADAIWPIVNTASASCSPAGCPNVYTASATWSTELIEPPVEPIEEVVVEEKGCRWLADAVLTTSARWSQPRCS